MRDCIILDLIKPSVGPLPPARPPPPKPELRKKYEPNIKQKTLQLRQVR